MGRLRTTLAALGVIAAVSAAPAGAQQDPRAAPAPGSGLASLRIYNASVSVPDLDRAIGWYRDVLGFREESRVRFSPQVEIAMVEKNGFRIEFLKVADQRPYEPLVQDPPEHLRVLGIKNLVFRVDDLAAADAELKAKGVALLWESRPFPEAKSKVTMFRDPFRQLVTLWQLL